MKQSAMTIYVATTRTENGIQIDNIYFDTPCSISGVRKFVGECYDDEQSLQTELAEFVQTTTEKAPWGVRLIVPAVDPDR